jgi:hypothetical protein
VGCEVEEGTRQCGHLRGRVDGRDFQDAAGLHVIRRHCTCQGLRVLADISDTFSLRLNKSDSLNFNFCHCFTYHLLSHFVRFLDLNRLSPRMRAVVDSYHFEASVIRRQIYRLLLALTNWSPKTEGTSVLC